MRILRRALVSLLVVIVLSGTAMAAGYAVQRIDDGRATARSEAGAAKQGGAPGSPAELQEPAEKGEPAPIVKAAPTLEEKFRIERGDRGQVVRELQSRLYQLAWWPELTTGVYDAATAEAVSGFQGKRKMRRTGVVDETTWKRLRAMTKQPTHDQIFNILHPGPTLIGAGATGDRVRDLQARLVQIQWLFGDVSGTYDSATVAAIKGFQAKRKIPVTGNVDQRTMDRLTAMTYTPSHAQKHNIRPKPTGGTTAALDSRCLTGRALCIDKSSNSVRWVIDGQVKATLSARFGSTVNNTPTREGAFTVYRKSRDHVSSLYDSEMPFAMFFSGGQAVHYSSDFAAYGYSGASHGCVNIRDHGTLSWVYDQVQIGDKAVVYWS